MNEKNIYDLALGMVPGIGNILAKQLIQYFGSSESVFKTKKRTLMKIPGIGEKSAESILKFSDIKQAEKELKYIEKNKIEVIFFNEDKYPYRLKQIHTAPYLIFYKGNADLNAEKMVSIVGTRNSTEYGKRIVKEIISEIVKYNVLIISGLAYGIDTLAHREALNHHLKTVGIMGSGFSNIYPSSNSDLARSMIQSGGLITEYPSYTKPDAPNFPARNRIIAGLSDVVIVVEAAIKGGALITAKFANDFNREVFAVPGNLNSRYSDGCNFLIKTHQSALYTSVKDVEYLMNWDIKTKKKQLFPNLTLPLFTDEENTIMSIIRENDEIYIDDLIIKSEFNSTQVAGILLNLELNGIIKCLPGKKYQIADAFISSSG